MIIRTPNNPQEWEDYFSLRYNVLRKPLNQPLGSERNDGDSTGKHFALYDNTILTAIGRLDIVDSEKVQARFVAVLEVEHGKGYGKQIMHAMEEYGRLNGYHKMILHARDYALNFYEKLGYQKIEKSYKLFDVLQHYLMTKNLN